MVEGFLDPLLKFLDKEHVRKTGQSLKVRREKGCVVRGS